MWVWGSTPNQSPLSPSEGTAILRWLQCMQVNRFDYTFFFLTIPWVTQQAVTCRMPGAGSAWSFRSTQKTSHSSGAALKAASGPLVSQLCSGCAGNITWANKLPLSIIPMLEGTKNPAELHPQVWGAVPLTECILFKVWATSKTTQCKKIKTAMRRPPVKWMTSLSSKKMDGSGLQWSHRLVYTHTHSRVVLKGKRGSQLFHLPAIQPIIFYKTEIYTKGSAGIHF